MKFYKSMGSSVVDDDGGQILVVLPVNCSKKLSREVAELIAQYLTHQEDVKDRKKVNP